MKDTTVTSKSAITTYLKEMAIKAVIGFMVLLLVFLAAMGLRALFDAFIPEEHQMMFVLTGIIVSLPVVLYISAMIDDFKKKKAQKEYNERLKWQKERSQMSFEERLYGTKENTANKRVLTEKSE